MPFGTTSVHSIYGLSLAGLPPVAVPQPGADEVMDHGVTSCEDPAVAAHSSPSCRGLVGSAVATGIATVLMPPARIPTGVRRSVHVSLGLAAAGATVWVLGHTEPSGPGQPADLPLPTLPNSIPLHTRLVLSTLLGSLAAASSAAGMRLDTAAEQALRRRGVRRPRLWIRSRRGRGHGHHLLGRRAKPGRAQTERRPTGVTPPAGDAAATTLA
jgi:hypothetical protein